MRYRGRHRQVATRQQRMRRASTVAAVAATALIAPLALSGPVASQAAVTTPGIDTLVNHPEWLPNASDPAVAAQITDLQREMTARGMSVDPAQIAAYRVPAVEGFVTYVTAHPETFTVRPNPELLYHTPDGDTAVSPTEVVARLLESSAEPAGVDCDIETNVKVSLCPGQLVRALIANDWLQTLDDLALYLQRTITGISLPEIQPTLDYLNRVIQNIKDFRLTGDKPVDTDDEITMFWAAVDAVQAEAEELVGYLLTINPDDILAMLAPVSHLVQELTQEIEALKAQVDALSQTLLNDIDPERDGAEVFNIVPTATGSLPVNLGTSPTEPLSQPVAQPMEPTTALVPAVGTVYKDTYVEDEPEWNRNNENCFGASANAWYRMICWHIDNQINDANSDKTYWQFNLEGASYAKQKRGMFHTWVEGVPQTGSASQQFDGSLPKPTQAVGGDSGCASASESISLSGGKPVQVGYAYSYSITTCETYLPRGYDDQGHWSNKWHFNPDRDSNGVGYGSDDANQRHVAFTMGVKTASTDGGVVWDLFTGTEVSKKYCC